jgi:hypothetical protein
VHRITRAGLALAMGATALAFASTALAMPPEVRQSAGNCTTYGDICMDPDPGNSNGGWGSDASTKGPNDGSGWQSGAGAGDGRLPGSGGGGGLRDYDAPGSGAGATASPDDLARQGYTCDWGSTNPKAPTQTGFYCTRDSRTFLPCTDVTPWWKFWGRDWACTKP